MWYKVAILVLLSTLARGDLPEDDFRIIKKQDLLAADSDIFEDNSTKSYTRLLFDVARDQIVVGARDAIYRISLRGLRQLERADWPAPADKLQLCQDKGQTEEDCHNYVKVLLSHGHKLFACGTHAFSPKCSWREIESIGTVLEWVNGIAHSPYNPHSNVTAILAGNGEYYAGTPTDFSSSDTAIYRSRDASQHKTSTLRTTQYDLNWLNEPQFVGSFEDDLYVYFIFREIAVEFLNCGKVIYSRIGRVCKNDSGGHLMLKDNWSTFLKARLNCSAPGDFPFYYDEAQSVEYLAQDKILVITFTTPENSIAGSAICMYNMSDITAAFEGPYKVQNSPNQMWESRSPSQQSRDHFKCIPDSRPHQGIEYHSYYLMYDAIQPITGEPVYTSTLQRFTHITVDRTQAKHIGKQYVLFVATLGKEIWKLAVLPGLGKACLIEKWRLQDEKGGYDVKTMQFVKDTMSVYLGTETSVVRLQAHRCRRYGSRATCLAAADPYCGWNDVTDTCVEASAYVHDANFYQNTDRCIDSDAVVEGGWSAWSAWSPCEQAGPGEPYAEPDYCRCRTRVCDNPKPKNGGSQCKGSSIQVTNCTVHGGWSVWGGWSSCSASCGIAVKSRRRACSAPEPRHGGRVCVGLDTQHLYCSSLPPCPDPSLSPVDGGWSEWSSWSTCTADGGQTCGNFNGWKERRRSCTNPTPSHGGLECEGEVSERVPCDLRPCDLRRAVAWTPWVYIPDNSTDGSYIEKRFKFVCRSPSPDQIKLTVSKEEERFCNEDGECMESRDLEWFPWGTWSTCSRECGGGIQTRRRHCRRDRCRGAAEITRPCNTGPCSGEWSCWSEWSTCDAQCGAAGHRTRTRRCLSPSGCGETAAVEKQICFNNCDDTESGWGPWQDWSECSAGARSRRRLCITGACTGHNVQLMACTGDDDDDEDNEAMAAYTPHVEMASFVTATDSARPNNVAALLGCGVFAFAMGALCCLGAVYYGRRRKRRARIPSSPHYITANQNSYVTVPLKDVPRKAKRQPSFSGISSGSSILLSKSNNLTTRNNHNNTLTTPKLYPKAIANEYDSMGTLRRHSNLTNNRNNLDYEEDKFY